MKLCQENYSSIKSSTKVQQHYGYGYSNCVLFSWQEESPEKSWKEDVFEKKNNCK